MFKKTAIVIIVLAAIAGGIWFYFNKQTASAPAANPVETALVKKGLMVVDVACSGTVNANQNVDIKCQAGGQIVKLPFQLGAVIKRGDLLLEVDPTPEEQALEVAQRNLEQAQFQYQTAQLNLKIAEQNLITDTTNAHANLLSAQAAAANDQILLNRTATLLKENLDSQEDYDNAKTTLTQAQASVALAQAAVNKLKTEALQVKLQGLSVKLANVAVESNEVAVKQAQINLSYTKVMAPLTGVVSNVAVQIGQVISSALTNVGGGTTILTLVDLSHIYVLANVNESDIDKVHLGDTVYITGSAYPGKVFLGKVVQMGPVGTNNSNVITFPVNVEVLGKDKQLLKPNMTAEVDIIANRLHNVVYIPLQAVQVQGRKDFVNVVGPDGKQTLTPVTLGVNNGREWQVLNGLKPGQQVVVYSGDYGSTWMRHH